MSGSKGKSFTMRHCFDVLQHLPRWKLRDQEHLPKKAAMVSMDDSEDERDGRNNDKPEGNNKAKERLKLGGGIIIEGQFVQMMKSKEAIELKTLEAKLVIIDKKKEVKIEKVEATREEARNKAKLEETKINVKKATTMKEYWLKRGIS
jgi:hypothetical protein